jgi:hypothetical protein
VRAYTREIEERVRLHLQVRSWTRSGLVERSQAAALDADLRTDLKRTNRIPRFVLAFFTVVVVAAAVGLVRVILALHGSDLFGVNVAFGVGCAVMAQWLVSKVRLYRFGIEEALAMAAVVFMGRGASLFVDERHMTVGLSVAAFIALVVYLRLGLIYSAVVAMCCASAIPFQFDLADWVRRLIAAATLGAVFAVARSLHRRYGDDYPGDEYASLQALSWLGAYLAVNLRIFDIAATVPTTTSVPGGIYWTTYVLIWLLPAAGLTIAIRERDRQLLAANLVMALVTLVTNKPYLGWTRTSWDPMLLGAMLTAVAIVIRRWLSRGEAGQRAGFTSVPLLEVDREGLRPLGAISFVVQPHAAAAHSVHSDGGFDGGRSGGGGADAGF